MTTNFESKSCKSETKMLSAHEMCELFARKMNRALAEGRYVDVTIYAENVSVWANSARTEAIRLAKCGVR